MFKQGLDVRLLDEDKAELLFASRYDGDFIFAFDNPDDATLIEEKIQLIGEHLNLITHRVKFYVLCGFDQQGKYDENFWQRDLQSVFDRADLLKRYNCLPYVMRHKNYLLALPSIRKTYIQVARWTNQPQFFLKKSFAQFTELDKKYKAKRRCAK